MKVELSLAEMLLLRKACINKIYLARQQGYTDVKDVWQKLKETLERELKRVWEIDTETMHNIENLFS